MGLESIPSEFADYFEINLGSAQIILSIVVIFAIILPMMYLAKDKHQLPIVISVFLAEILLVGIGWIPFWVLIATMAVSVMAITLLTSKIVTGD